MGAPCRRTDSRSKLTPLAPLGGEIPHLCEPVNVFDAVAPLGGKLLILIVK